MRKVELIETGVFGSLASGQSESENSSPLYVSGRWSTLRWILRSVAEKQNREEIQALGTSAGKSLRSPSCARTHRLEACRRAYEAAWGLGDWPSSTTFMHIQLENQSQDLYRA